MNVPAEAGRVSTPYDAAPAPPGGVPDLQVVWGDPGPADRLSIALRALADRIRRAPVTTRRIAVATVAVTVTAVGALAIVRVSASEGLPETPTAVAVDAGRVSVATAATPLVDVYAAPDAPHPIATLAHPGSLGAPLVFEVEAEYGDWLRVRLPTPPAGNRGWVRSDAVTRSEHSARMTVDVVARELVVVDGGETVMRVPIALGSHDLPPAGRTFVSEVLDAPATGGVYGSRVFTLAGFPNSSDKLFRGSGLVAIHGSSGGASISEGRTPGSIALRDADAARLASMVTAGTPVTVVGELVRGAPPATGP